MMKSKQSANNQTTEVNEKKGRFFDTAIFPWTLYTRKFIFYYFNINNTICLEKWYYLRYFVDFKLHRSYSYFAGLITKRIRFANNSETNVMYLFF